MTLEEWVEASVTRVASSRVESVHLTELSAYPRSSTDPEVAADWFRRLVEVVREDLAHLKPRLVIPLTFPGGARWQDTIELRPPARSDWPKLMGAEPPSLYLIERTVDLEPSRDERYIYPLESKESQVDDVFVLTDYMVWRSRRSVLEGSREYFREIVMSAYPQSLVQ